ncbi:MAG: hypothetical protein U5K37_02155 [Natrialbaceae archaeon]|nr:hypothetical protein [Natrialbaceae archaeon]
MHRVDALEVAEEVGAHSPGVCGAVLREDLDYPLCALLMCAR